MSELKKYFLSFGGPASNYHDAVKRICSQAEKINTFDKIIGLNELDLKSDEEFWSTHKDFINSNPRGYGYWLWKPYIIKKTLDQMIHDDILLYLDCGCEINHLAKEKLEKYIELVKKKSILVTSTGSSDCKYTKKDLIIKIGLENEIELLKKTQYQANYILIKKTPKIMNLINEWYHIASTNYNLINDEPSKEKNFDEFIEHRHDQSIFSLLLKKYEYENNDLDPSWVPNFDSLDTFKNHTIRWVVWVARNKSSNSILDKLLLDYTNDK